MIRLIFCQFSVNKTIEIESKKIFTIDKIRLSLHMDFLWGSVFQDRMILRILFWGGKRHTYTCDPCHCELIMKSKFGISSSVIS